MERFQGLIGVVLILGIAWLFSNNKKRINYRLVISGILLQVVIALLILKVPFVKSFFQKIGSIITHIEAFAKEGAAFVYGGLIADSPVGAVPYRTPGVFIFGFSVLATIIWCAF
ncbi:MAG: Na+ dependent nucleoside transporter N-terminal domain-containing protein [Ferruginibacter sp.]